MIKNKLRCSVQSGFSLIEVLLAAMIVALIGGSLYATFAAGFKLDQRIKKAFADLDESRIIIEQLHRDLGRAVFYDFGGSYPEKKVFSDDGKILFFVIDDDGLLRWVKYFIDQGNSGQVQSTKLGVTTTGNVSVSNIVIEENQVAVLRREEGLFHHMLNSEKELLADQSEILSRRIAQNGWGLMYASSLTTSSKVEWKSSWAEDGLPAAVRLKFSLQDDAGRVQEWTRDFILPAGGRNEN